MNPYLAFACEEGATNLPCGAPQRLFHNTAAAVTYFIAALPQNFILLGAGAGGSLQLYCCDSLHPFRLLGQEREQERGTSGSLRLAASFHSRKIVLLLRVVASFSRHCHYAFPFTQFFSPAVAASFSRPYHFAPPGACQHAPPLCSPPCPILLTSPHFCALLFSW
ncbi:hypothetical protein NDU88_001235 [Pleurodeles waltl]|uniref:Uncharacterized protein n=1 Tax=Pleurodeles waltl TaxID=8319 RepID=A0AAV7LZ32_PLEWA|nr:hypothetical protein NDU88_001235 [Pleurodeles waltl]